MIKCIVIDDEVTICEEIEQKIKNWSKIASQNVEVIVLNSGNDIAWSRLKEIDIVFLDVELKDEENGVDIARKLRTNNYTGEIVFLTAFSEYVFLGYDVRAYNYFLKPVTDEIVSKCLDYVAGLKNAEELVFSSRGETGSIQYKDIVYIESFNHSTVVKTVNGEYKIPKSFGTVMQMLPHSFVKCHRTIVVNLAYVKRIKPKEVIMINDEELPISQTYKQMLKEAFLSFYS